MKFHLQLGYGMMKHSRKLVGSWGEGTVILSPRDLEPEHDQLHRLADNIRDLRGGSVLLDPQFYFPRSDHHRLTSYDFWPEDYQTDVFMGGPGLRRLIGDLLQLNRELGTAGFVAPGLRADTVSDDWLDIQRVIIEESRKVVGDMRLLATVALGEDVVKDQDQMHKVLESTLDHDIDAVYLLCETPNGRYLVDDPLWLANILDLVAGLRLHEIQVILGYANHQLLLAAVSGATALCAGTWLNVRRFCPERFHARDPDDVRRSALWYYCPQALSEFKVRYLDVAHAQGVLHQMAPRKELENEYASPLFEGGQPTATGYDESFSFRHYLHCLHGQVTNSVKDTFDATLAYHREQIDQAETVLDDLRNVGVVSRNRSFDQCLDAAVSALAMLESQRGPMLRRHWDRINS